MPKELFLNPRTRKNILAKRELQRLIAQEQAEIMAGRRKGLSAKSQRLMDTIAASRGEPAIVPCYICDKEVDLDKKPRILTVAYRSGETDDMGYLNGTHHATDERQLALCDDCDARSEKYFAAQVAGGSPDDLASAEAAFDNDANMKEGDN